MWEIWVQSLGWEDPLEKGKATHSSILSWRIPMDRGAWRATVHGVAKSWTQLNNWMNGWNELKSTKVKASLVAQRVKHLPPMWETSVRSLGREDPV